MKGSKLMMQDFFFVLLFVWFSNDVDVLLVGEVFLFKSPLFCTPLVEMNRHCTSSEMLQSSVLYTGHTYTLSPHTQILSQSTAQQCHDAADWFCVSFLAGVAYQEVGQIDTSLL